MFRKQAVFAQNMTLYDIENMLPYEKDIYTAHIVSTIEEYKKQQKR